MPFSLLSLLLIKSLQPLGRDIFYGHPNAPTLPAQGYSPRQKATGHRPSDASIYSPVQLLSSSLLWIISSILSLKLLIIMVIRNYTPDTPITLTEALITHEDTMNPEAVLAVLPDNKEDAKSLKKIALALGLEISTHTDWLRAERSLARILRALIKWGWVACDRRRRKEGRRLWCNAYWKTELARQADSD